MTDHPLTNDIIEEISVSYLKNCESVKSNMRSAADWQLEQVIEWLKDELDYRSDIDPNLLSDLKKAMRPQEES